MNELASFLIFLSLTTLSSAASLLLVGSLSIFALAVLGFALGRLQVPWLAIALGVICIGTLHYGKEMMRYKYMYGGMYGNQSKTPQPWDYVAWFGEWTGYSIDALFNQGSAAWFGGQSFANRPGLIHLLLMVQEKTPGQVPYLKGATYVIVPQLLIPRFVISERASTHEGTTLLNIHYGKQSREDTLRTTIGWGLLNEAYANFGLLGCGLLAIF